MTSPLPRRSPNCSPRADMRSGPSEWRSARAERPIPAPSTTDLTLRSLIAGVILMFVLGVAILATTEMTIEGLHWLRDRLATGGAA